MSEHAFDPARLELARRRRGMTQTELAATVGVDSRAIRRWERGDHVPNAQALEALSRALGFPASFFGGTRVPDIGNVSFRARSRMSAANRDASHAGGQLAVELDAWVRSRYRLPAPDVPDLSGSSPDEAAVELRARWGLGDGPIANLVHTMESRGIRVFSLRDAARDVDAFSFWNERTPFVVLGTTKTPERSRFDGGHEIGHLVMHPGLDATDNDLESEADQFASAFLMPKVSFRASFPRDLTIPSLVDFKRRWRVSLAAAVRRARDVESITQRQYNHLCIELGRNGWRSSEPHSIEHELSQVLRKVLDHLRSSGRIETIARELSLRPGDVHALTFGMYPAPIEGGGSAATTIARSHLRLVK